MQDLSAQNTISYVMKTYVLCGSFLCVGNRLKIRVYSEQPSKGFCPVLLLSIFPFRREPSWFGVSFPLFPLGFLVTVENSLKLVYRNSEWFKKTQNTEAPKLSSFPLFKPHVEL